MDITLISNFAAAMLSIVNPIGNLPVFISYTAGETRPVRNWLALFISFTVFALLVIFLLIGNDILKFFGITISAFQISGGILLLLTGISMVRGGQASYHQDLAAKVAANPLKEAEFVYGKILVPLSIPLFVGPGAISTVILYSNQVHDPTARVALILVLGTVSLAVLVTLLLSDLIQRFLGAMGIQIATRLLGLVLAAIGIQFILDGLGRATLGLINPGILH